MSHFGMSFNYAFNKLSFQNAIMLTASVPKVGSSKKQEEKTKEVDAYGWLSGFVEKPKNENNGESKS